MWSWSVLQICARKVSKHAYPSLETPTKVKPSVRCPDMLQLSELSLSSVIIPKFFLSNEKKHLSCLCPWKTSLPRHLLSLLFQAIFDSMPNDVVFITYQSYPKHSKTLFVTYKRSIHCCKSTTNIWSDIGRLILSKRALFGLEGLASSLQVGWKGYLGWKG